MRNPVMSISIMSGPMRSAAARMRTGGDKGARTQRRSSGKKK
jgi:hypothetical protein